MTTLFTADLHLSANPRDAYRHKTMATIRKIAVERKVRRVVILGDLTEEKDNHGARLVNQIVEHMHELAGVCDEVLVLKGNHDYKDEEHPFFQFIGRLEGVRWINTPTELDLDGLGRCLFLPHTNNYKRDWDGLALSKQDWVFAHNAFEGAVSEHGARLHGIPVDVFGKKWDDYVLAGDIHKSQSVGCVTYVGAPYTVDFGDDYEPTLTLVRDGRLRIIPVPGPQKRLVEITEDEIGQPASTLGADAGDIVKLRVMIDGARHAHWHEIRDKARAWAEREEFTLHAISPVVEKGATPKKRDTRAKRDDQVTLRAYAKTTDVDDKTLDVGLSFLQEA